MEPHGIYRERNGWGTQHSVRVKYDEHQELNMAEDRYRARGYQPPFKTSYTNVEVRVGSGYSGWPEPFDKVIVTAAGRAAANEGERCAGMR